MQKAQKRVANFTIEGLLSSRTPFTNYNASIIAEIDSEGVYRVTHWKTVIWEYSLSESRTLQFDFKHYSQTTSALQGKIARAGLHPQEVRDMLGIFLDPILKKQMPNQYRRLAGMVRIGR